MSALLQMSLYRVYSPTAQGRGGVSSIQGIMALHCTALHCTALHCTALHCTALQCTPCRMGWISVRVPAAPGSHDHPGHGHTGHRGHTATLEDTITNTGTEGVLCPVSCVPCLPPCVGPTAGGSLSPG